MAPAKSRPRSLSRPEPNEVLDPSVRDSGIRVVGEMAWGTHACMFYETKADLLDTAVAYFVAGLSRNEFCIWAVSGPIDVADAKTALRAAAPAFDRQLEAGAIEILRGSDWYLSGDEFDLQRITGGWNAKLEAALARGYDGMRVSGNAFWIGTHHWKAFCEYEEELDRSLHGKRMIVLCTYPLQASRAVDVLDVARAHQFTAVRRHGEWEFLETPELRLARQEISRLRSALDILSGRLPAGEALTPRERLTLAQIVRGASTKEAARRLAISPRTVEFHRANIMRKLGARNTADLVRRVLEEMPAD
jgi:DNA-binding CsgD family transcriptional regulator